MHRVFKQAFLLILFIPGWSTPLYAQDSLQTETESVLDVRIPDVEIIEDYASDSDFNYQSIPENPESFAERFLYQLYMLFSFLFGNPIGGFVLRLFLYIAIGSLILVIINQTIGGNLINVFSRKNPEKSFSMNIGKEELDQLKLQEMLEKALSNSDFHAATRYLYLITLKMLNEHNLISFSIEKTNFDYERELASHPSSPLFTKLTSYYEFVEYGDFEIDKRGFSKVQTLFNSLKSKLNNG
ncbi:MAG: hypothetical protein JJ971_14270 [Balneolaceae bacterium]|nr:hypothetical protein [Balneolaceae bacterium]MBO6547567.1 hypothetical protein [Balneolaceae bacterium]MBO6648078.1 hypothetical protein [Balneolaceae bacterium]